MIKTEVIPENYVDLVLVHHLYDHSKKSYIFKSVPGAVKIGDLVGTNEDPESVKSLGKVIGIWKMIDIGSDNYKFICKLAGIEEIIGKIYYKFEREEIPE